MMGRTKGKRISEDARIEKSLEGLVSIVEEYQKQIGGVAPPDKSLKGSFNRSLKELAKVRGREMYFPYIGSGLGKGALVELEDGSVKYDFINGVGVHYFGHSNLTLIKKALYGALSDLSIQGNLQLNKESLIFQKRILELANRHGGRFDHCFLTTSGAMANENGLKIIFQKKRLANRLLAFEGCFMGRTLALCQVSDKPQNRKGLPGSMNVDYLPFVHQNGSKSDIQGALIALKKITDRYPGQHAGICFELVIGEGGFYPGNKDFFRAAMEFSKEKGIAILVDEIQTFGRTYKPFACQYFEIADLADVITVGKMTQVCATIYKKDFNPMPGLISQTYTGNTTSLSIGTEILDQLSRGNYFGKGGKIDSLYNFFSGKLKRLSKKYPKLIRGPYGIGAMVAFTFADGSPSLAKKFLNRLFDNGLIAFLAGSSPTRIRFLLPVGAIVKEDCEKAIIIIEKTLASFEDW